MCAEVRAGHSRGAVIIAKSPVWTAIHIVTRTVHLGGTPIFVSSTGEVGHTIEYEGEDAGTARVPSRHSVAAGAGRLCADVSTKVEVIIMGAGSVITRFPLLKAILITHVQV